MAEDIKLYITGGGSKVDVTDLAQTITWSGNYQQCARTLEFGLLSSPTDKNIPTVGCQLGYEVFFSKDGQTLFDGFIFSRDKSTDSSVINITCYDRGIYLKRNQAAYKFTNMTPEAITKRICTDFGITVGDIAATKVKISRNFVGVSLYNIIQTAYTLASKKTGEKYQIRFDGAKLGVVKKVATGQKLIIVGGSNLISASTSESIENMINQVIIYNSSDKLVGTEKDDEAISQYGRLQSYLRQEAGEDATTKAQELLADNGMSQKITIENLGDVSNITGNAVVILESYTGLYSLFYIDSDTHTWKKGLYLNKLVVDFKRIMDKQEVGELVR